MGSCDCASHTVCTPQVHFTLSKALEGYFQEAGRAGRDGQDSECVLLYAKRDGPRIINMIRRGAQGSRIACLSL